MIITSNKSLAFFDELVQEMARTDATIIHLTDCNLTQEVKPFPDHYIIKNIITVDNKRPPFMGAELICDASIVQQKVSTIVEPGYFRETRLPKNLEEVAIECKPTKVTLDLAHGITTLIRLNYKLVGNVLPDRDVLALENAYINPDKLKFMLKFLIDLPKRKKSDAELIPFTQARVGTQYSMYNPQLGAAFIRKAYDMLK